MVRSGSSRSWSTQIVPLPFASTSRRIRQGSNDRDFHTQEMVVYLEIIYWLVVWNIFSHILRRIIPTDFHIFQRGRYTTNQWWLVDDSSHETMLIVHDLTVNFLGTLPVTWDSSSQLIWWLNLSHTWTTINFSDSKWREREGNHSHDELCFLGVISTIIIYNYSQTTYNDPAFGLGKNDAPLPDPEIEPQQSQWLGINYFS